ncbi:LOW QUALITY PROTEIN: probable NADH dehydrogenase [ubiquinone] 1 alpha subcomplex subunit 12 [Procambarus clarkii]|uniref:LOW QUALITY PROTEIN: probable NADH dehydrogenase [ubiquinone] 1 alpha subcomplex subunit 12 n=1 Tax=Procambarus clarkii TaxID=6728 RepID=UPI003743CDD6
MQEEGEMNHRAGGKVCCPRSAVSSPCWELVFLLEVRERNLRQQPSWCHQYKPARCHQYKPARCHQYKPARCHQEEERSVGTAVLPSAGIVMASFFGLDKLVKAARIIKNHGGIRGSLYQLYRVDDLKDGTLVCKDALGNKYYENKQLTLGRDRWVIYHPRYGMDYDGSQVTVEWYGWLHHKTDKPPTEEAPITYSWVSEHTENKTGTEEAYMPYTTTKPKIEAWVPPKCQ